MLSFSSRHSLQLFPSALYASTRLKTAHLMVKGFLPSFKDRAYLESSVSVEYRCTLNDFISFAYLFLKVPAVIPMYSFVSPQTSVIFAL